LPPASETPPAPSADQNPLLADNFGVEDVARPPAASQTRDNPIANPGSESVPDIRPATPATASPTPRTAPAASQTIVAATGDSNGPLDVTPSSSSGSQAGGGFMVQVSSQRSEEVALATFKELQRRYPSILGERTPDIQRADLGDRGVYYRVRVGYPTRDEAARMCENLKAAGGDCLLASR
jgi:cell division septation protein DedD